MTTLTPPTTDIVLDGARIISDDSYFFEHLIKIDDRNQNLISFKLNPAQEILHDRLTGRDIVIKAGQLGITTFFLARDFKRTITRPGTTSVLVAHEEFLTQRLLSRVNYMYDKLPEVIRTDLGPIKKPIRNHDSAHEKSFPELNSIFYIGTARAFVFGRGEPIHNFIGSEVAFWPDPKKILTPTMQRVPLAGSMVLESTPNGEGGEFYEYVQESLDGQGRWTLHQLGWWLEPEYRIPHDASYAIPIWAKDRIVNYSQEELGLINKTTWDDTEVEERIRWRRVKIAEIHELFWQEFFEDISSCFVASNNPYYNIERITELRNDCYPTYDILTLSIGGDVKVWERPDDDVENPIYFIAVDPGQGKITTSVATVWQLIRQTDGSYLKRHCATMSGLYDPQTFAPMVIELGYYYKTARIAAERNGHGLAFCAELSNYPNVYRQTDVVSGRETSVIGWATTGAARIDNRGTKMYMMSELNHMLWEMECHDIDIIRQIANVRVGADKKLVFLGNGDDFHDSAAIFAATAPTAMAYEGIGLVSSRGKR